MSRDFRPSRIATLAASTPFSLTSVQALRNSTEMTYQLGRTAHVETAIADQVAFTPRIAPTSEETVIVYKDGVLVESGYTFAAGTATFDAAPGVGKVIRVDYLSTLSGVVPAGGVTFFDTYKQNADSADVLIPAGETVCEIM